MNLRKGLLGLAAALTISTAPAQAAIIFDNFSGTGAPDYVEETRNATFTFGTVINVLNTTLVNDIALRYRINNDMDLTLGIWDSDLAGTFGSLNWTPVGNNLLYSQTMAVTTTALLDYVTFANVDFTFQANTRYDIGVWGSTGSLLGSWDIDNGSGNINTVQGPFESINHNANIAPGSSNQGYAGVDPHIRLITDDVRAVPEPMTLALFGIGLVGVGLSSKRRKQA